VIPPDAPSSSRRSAADRVHHELRHQLLLGGFPYGERLVEEQLAERYGTSRTPVREALRRLEGDGHIMRDPSGGMRPNPPRVSNMRDLYEVRIVIEDLVVRRAAAQIPNEVLDELRGEWHDLRQEFDVAAEHPIDPDFVHLDEAFHEGLARASGNTAAERHLRDINERIRVLRIHDFTTPERIDTTIAEHLEIIDAVATGRADSGAALMRVHVERSAQVVEQRVGELLAKMFDSGEDPR
jgi:DNA-binding GntR family transcriptional regulator